MTSTVRDVRSLPLPPVPDTITVYACGANMPGCSGGPGCPDSVIVRRYNI